MQRRRAFVMLGKHASEVEMCSNKVGEAAVGGCGGTREHKVR